MHITRRRFTALTVSPFLAASRALSAPGPSRIQLGITTNTRGGWENDVFLSFREAREVGYRNVESFIHYFVSFWDKPEALQQELDEIGVRFVTISNGGPLETHFEDPARHAKIIEDHLKLVRFIKHFGCKHLKINMGPRRPEGTTQADLQHMAKCLNELGPRISELGVKFAIHAHMWNQFENRREIDYILEHTDAKHVWFVLDTGHITLAGIDPVKLTQELGHRIVEFHMKDTKPETRGGAKSRLDRPDVMKDPPFFPLGQGGVDFPAIKAHLDKIAWQGWFTVELDSSPFRPPKESARISREYIETKLKVRA
jgi:inosose dehydratase